jgi:hypothetical protein
MDKKWADWFDGLQIMHEKDGTSTLDGPLPDQAALHSILRKIRDLNLQLISVNQVNIDTQDETLLKEVLILIDFNPIKSN